VEAWERVEPTPGSPVPGPTPLFAKVDLEALLGDAATAG